MALNLKAKQPNLGAGAGVQKCATTPATRLFQVKSTGPVKADTPLVVVIDTREQRPFNFVGPMLPAVEVRRVALKTGDYSLEGLEGVVAVERKSLDDLVGCLTRGRARFERELVRGAAMARFAVVVEAPWLALARGQYRSRMSPRSAVESVIALQARYGIPFNFAGDRKAAEYLTFSWLRHCRKELEAMNS